MKNSRIFSLATRNALVYFILFVISLGLIGALIIFNSSREIHNLTEKRLLHNNEIIKLKFEGYFKAIVNDVHQIGDNPSLKEYIYTPNDANLASVEDAFYAMLKNKPNYFQIRLLSTQNKGEELIRVEKKNKEIRKTPKALLQFKNSRDYFQEILKLPLDSIYFSKIDLNREFGKISTPITPTTRIGKKIEGNKNEQFILLVNINLTQLFEELKHTVPKHYELRIFNGNGDYFIHPDYQKEFAFEYGKPSYFQTEFPSIQFNSNDWSKPIIAKNTVNQFSQLNFQRINYALYCDVSANKDDVYASFYEWKNKIILYSSIIAIFFLAIGFLLMRNQNKELGIITQELTTFSENLKPTVLHVDRKDEIGDLARSFEKMSSKITESHQLMLLAKNNAEKANQDKSDFIANMSHEIKNPLQAILGSIEILNQNDKLDEQIPYLNSIQFSTQQLNYMVMDVLDYNKLKNKEITLSPTWNNLHVFCQELINSIQYLADYKKIDLQLLYPEELKQYIYAYDYKRLYQILYNLLTNAIKFTNPAGKVTLQVKAINHNSVRFEVIDNGSGIAPNTLKKILDRNFSSDYSTGSGLGLVIIKDIIELHGSTLKIDSKINVGSKFSFDLKLDRQLLNNLPVPKIDQMNSILIIEDDLEIQNYYAHIFQSAKTEILNSPNELESITETFDFIITDLHFSNTKISVEQYLLNLKERCKPDGLIIVISGTAYISKEKGIKSLLKPIDKNSLQTLMFTHHIGIEYNPIRFGGIEEDYDHDPALIKKAMRLIVPSWEKDIKNLSLALKNQDIKKFKDIQHRLVTNLRRFGLENVIQFIDEISIKMANEKVDDTQLTILLQQYLIELKQYQAAI
ncbi:hypothetical protein DNU06_14075 [Putridiphycobacter roseus]|uniref:histidine kinase n=1 Tax=Putridiphycobacter roseus TaxID=2219161 RepID=A0A2W1NKR0_9FLAO|nr:HAMP domain-containing sensor histidine kinase [Putridiphycobacter roseus]PZE16252.1 hypothetical protein DNU06_14075 [Putridiphycobacter roseus]